MYNPAPVLPIAHRHCPDHGRSHAYAAIRDLRYCTAIYVGHGCRMQLPLWEGKAAAASSASDRGECLVAFAKQVVDLNSIRQCTL